VIAMRCSFCPSQLHLAPATLHGPPDKAGKVKQLVACRTCWKRIYERSKLRNSRPAADGGRMPGTPAWPQADHYGGGQDGLQGRVSGLGTPGGRVARRATPHDGTPPGLNHRAA